MRRILLSLAALFFAAVAGYAVPMKARVIQPLFAQGVQRGSRKDLL